MLKLTLLTLLILGVSTIYNNSQENNLAEFNYELRIPDEAILDFSYDMHVLKYWQVANDSERNSLRDYQKMALIPQKESMKVKGYLEMDGTPHLEVEYTDRENRPRVQMNGRGHDFDRVHRVVMDNNQVISYNKSGKEILKIDVEELKHFDLAKNLVNKIDPSGNFKTFLEDAKNQGWEIHNNEKNLFLIKNDEQGEHNFIFDKKNGLPFLSKLINEREIVTTNYKYECIDGRYVLVLQRTSIVKKHVGNNQPLMEFISLVELENIIFNQ